jgi:hypothetical protein
MELKSRPRPRSRRGFDHLVVELSVAAGRHIPRYPLWLKLHALGFDPERLDRESATAFCGRPLEVFLAEHGMRLPERALLRVRKSIRDFDPTVPTPYERMAALGD